MLAKAEPQTETEPEPRALSQVVPDTHKGLARPKAEPKQGTSHAPLTSLLLGHDSSSNSLTAALEPVTRGSTRRMGMRMRSRHAEMERWMYRQTVGRLSGVSGRW